MEERPTSNGHTHPVPPGAMASAVVTTVTSGTKSLVLREWSVRYAYSSFYVEQIEDLDAAAEALVRSGVATSAYVADSSVYWLKDGQLRKEIADLRWREHETHAHMQLPKDVDGWAALGIACALLQRFSEKKVVSPLPGPQHEYVRAAMEPSLIGFGDEHLVICPTLKLYKTGVFTISYEVTTPEVGIGVSDFIVKYVNLFARWCDDAWVPHAIARIGATAQLHHNNTDRSSRKVNLGMVTLMRAVADRVAETVKVEDYEFSMYPAHVPLDEFLTETLLGDGKDVVLPPAATSVDLRPKIEAEGKEPFGTTDEAAVSSDGDEVQDEVVVDDEAATQSYILSDMFDQAEYAVRAALDPPSEGKLYIRRGLSPRLTRGDYWQCRPQVSIEKFDDQPATASEIREMFGEDLGRIMVRVPHAPPKLARAQLGESLRVFEDHSLHISSAISLCVYASDECDKMQSRPASLRPMERACTFEMVDYLAMRCHQLDQHATLAKSVAEARAVRTDLAALENLARTAFRTGELNDVTMTAWERLRLPMQVQEVREKVSLASEAAQERSGERSSRFNVALTLVFGVVGAAGLTDAFTKPVWTTLGLPLPDRLEGPVCFGISAVLVSLIVWFVWRLNKT